MINLHSNTTILEVTVWMDGGSVTLKCINMVGEEFTIEFHQSAIMKSSSSGKMPGRIYLNNSLIGERSPTEKLILEVLEKAINEDGQLSLEDQNCIKEKLKYIRSEAYLKNNKIVESQRLEIIGIEFDWIGQDQNGKYGLFSSAGRGVVPMNVIEDYQSHNKITSKLDLPNIGSDKVWDDFSNYGFYVFDWELNKGAYILKSKPTGQLSNELTKKVEQLRSLKRFEVFFENVLEIKL